MTTSKKMLMHLDEEISALNKKLDVLVGVVSNKADILSRPTTTSGNNGSMTMTLAKAIEPDKEKPKEIYQCSVCTRQFTGMNELQGFLHSTGELEDYKNVSRTPGKFTYVYCGVSCHQTLGTAESMLSSGVVKWKDTRAYQDLMAAKAQKMKANEVSKK